MKEQIYNDVVTKFLPLVERGVSITAEYFSDIFSRYIKYLLIVDSIHLCVAILTFISLVVAMFLLGRKINLLKELNKDLDYFHSRRNKEDAYSFLWFCLLCITAIVFIDIFIAVQNLIQTLLIPELRVYESLKVLK